MNMLKSFGVCMVCAVLLSSGLFAQNTDVKANQIEVKAQEGEVLGSLEQKNPFIPEVSIDAGWKTKYFNRGVVWDTNTNASLGVDFTWSLRDYGNLSIGFKGQLPTRNTNGYWQSSDLDYSTKTYKGAFYEPEGFDKFYYEYWHNLDNPQPDGSWQNITFGKNIPIYDVHNKVTHSSRKHFREKNKFDEQEFSIEYDYTFEAPVVGDVSITAGWSYFRENNIYSRLNNIKYEFEYCPYYINLDIFNKVYNNENGILATASKYADDMMETVLNWITPGTQLSDEAIIKLFGDELSPDIVRSILGEKNVFQMYGYDYDLEKLMELSKEHFPDLDPAVGAYIIGYKFLEGMDGIPSEEERNKIISEWQAQAQRIREAENYRLLASRTIKIREKHNQEFKLGFGLDNVLNSDTYILNPNMSINFETTGHLWMQYGVKFNMSLAKLVKNLSWSNSLDAFWFDHDYFKVSERQYLYVADKNGKYDEKMTNYLFSIYNDVSHRYDNVAHSPSGFKTMVFKTQLDYNITEHVTISPSVSLLHYLNDICEHQSDNDLYFQKHYYAWFGINLNFTF
ncbi:MAG: hypothetical protein K5787_12935 [Lentisphaeria bacterium]|nr:hypothetical protein [Lentisphaeria bacterium]